MSRGLILILCLTSSYFLKAQQNHSPRRIIDSLRQLVILTDNDTLRLSYETNIGRTYRFINPDSAKLKLKSVLSQYKGNLIDPNSQAFAYNVLADIYRLELEIDSAIYFYEEAINQFLNLEDRSPFLSLVPAYGNVLMKHGKIQKGRSLFHEAIKVATEMNDPHFLGMLYVSFGNVLYDIQDDPLKAKTMFLKGLKTLAKPDETARGQRIGLTLHLGMAKIYSGEEVLDSAIYHANIAFLQAKEVRYMQKAIVASNVLCKSYLQQGNFELARRYNEESFILFREVREIRAIVKARILRLRIKNKFREYDSTIQDAETLLSEYQGQLTNSQKEEIFNSLFDAQSYSGNYLGAIKSKDSLLHYTHQNYKEKHSAHIAELYDETLLIEQQAENKVLLIRQEEFDKRSRLQKFAVAALGIGLLFALGWALSTYRLFHQKNQLSIQLEDTVMSRTQQLQESNEQLIQANYELKTLTYIASHDIKEPMRNIGGLIGLINRRLPKDLQIKFQKQFDMVNTSIKQLYTLIEDFTRYISFSKGDDLEIKQVALEPIVKQIQEDILQTYPHSQFTWSSLETIEANPSAIYFILKNLIENAIKFNHSPIPWVHIQQKLGKEGTRLVIEDNGIGIPEEYQDSIFEMHKRLHSNADYEGSGLGLSIVKILVQKLNGSIELTSNVGHGSTFVIVLPAPIYEEKPEQKQQTLQP